MVYDPTVLLLDLFPPKISLRRDVLSCGACCPGSNSKNSNGDSFCLSARAAKIRANSSSSDVRVSAVRPGATTVDDGDGVILKHH